MRLHTKILSVLAIAAAVAVPAIAQASTFSFTTTGVISGPSKDELNLFGQGTSSLIGKQFTQTVTFDMDSMDLDQEDWSNGVTSGNGSKDVGPHQAPGLRHQRWILFRPRIGVQPHR